MAGDGVPVTGTKVALAFWNGFTGGDGPFMKQIVDDFNQANPNVTVSMTSGNTPERSQPVTSLTLAPARMFQRNSFRVVFS